LKNKVLLNSVSNIVDFIANVVITLLMTPLYLHMLGQHDYGLWEMANAIVGYMGMLDLGMRASVTRETAFLKQKNELENISTTYATALIYMAALGAVVALSCLAWALVSPETLSENGSNIEKYTLFLVLLGATAFLSFMRTTAEGVLEGLQKYVVKNTANLLIKIGSASYLYLNLNVDNGIVLLIQTALVATFLRLVVYNLLILFTAPKVTFLKVPSIKVFIKLIKFGAKSMVNGIAFSLDQTSGMLLIGLLSSPALIPLYSIPKALTQYIATFIEKASSALMPHFTGVCLEKEKPKLVSSFLFSSKIFVWFLVTAIVFVVMFGADFTDVWLGGQLDKVLVEYLLLLFSISILLERINPLAVRLATAHNRHGSFAKLRSVSTLFLFALSYVLIDVFGVAGAIYAKIILGAIFLPRYNQVIFKLLDISLRDYWRHVLFKNAFIFILLLAISKVVSMQVSTDTASGLLVAFITISISSVIFFITFGLSESQRLVVLKLLKLKA